MNSFTSSSKPSGTDVSSASVGDRALAGGAAASTIAPGRYLLVMGLVLVLGLGFSWIWSAIADVSCSRMGPASAA